MVEAEETGKLHCLSFSILPLIEFFFFHSFHGLMNSINWLASSVWVFIAQLVEHCSANAEATGLNLVEAPKNFFWATSQFLKLQFNFDGHIFISKSFKLFYVIITYALFTPNPSIFC